MKKIFFCFIISLILLTTGNTTIKDSIFATVGDKAITRSDIINEIKIILILNNQTYSEEIKEQLDRTAIQSIIKRTIKKIATEKYNLKYNKEDVFKELNLLANNLDMDLDSFKQTFITNNLDFSSIIERIKINLLWNSLIFSVYKDRLSVNIDEIDEQLKLVSERKNIKEYLISEIIIKPVSKDKIKSTIENIKNEINVQGFEKVAMEQSISETSLKGGNLGWIRENEISKEFKTQIIKTPLGNISDPIFLPQGIVLFKVRDIKSAENIIDLEEAKNNLVRAEKMKILNMYSLSHYDKLRRTISIVYF